MQVHQKAAMSFSAKLGGPSRRASYASFRVHRLLLEPGVQFEGRHGGDLLDVAFLSNIPLLS